MHDLGTLKRLNEWAVEREYSQLLDRLHEIESALGIAPTSGWSFPELVERVDRLHANAMSWIDPDDPETQTEPIYLGEFS